MDDTRLTKLEERISKLETNIAVDGERHKTIKDNFAGVNKRLDRLDAHISKLVWLIIGTIITIGLTMLTSGRLPGG